MVFLKLPKNKNGIANEVIQRLKPVYALEEKMRKMKLNFHTRKRLRQKQSWPILKALHTWLKQNATKVPAKSKLSEAVQYTLNQWIYLIRFLRHGSVEIDTNWVENQERPIALVVVIGFSLVMKKVVLFMRCGIASFFRLLSMT